MIERLLEAWRVTCDPRVEAAIVRHGRRLARAKGPIIDASITGGKKLEATWHAIANDTPQAELDRLLDVPWSLDWAAMLARVRVLAQYAADPRLARKLIAIARWHLSRPSVALHEAIVPLLVESVTPTIAPWLDAVLDARGTHMHTLYAPVRKALHEVVCRAADPALTDGEPDLESLWADVYAEPGDLERRAVLGDALVDDPRGELVQLQLTDEKRARGRAARLLSAHIDEWIGPLPMVQRDSVRFARGFPIALIAHPGGAMIERTLDRPEWRTLEEVSLGCGSVEIPASDLGPLLDRMPLLHTLDLDTPWLLQLRGVFPTIRTLAMRGSEWVPSREMFPNLRVLAGTWRDLDRAQRIAAALGVDAIVHRGIHLERVVAMRHIGPAETRITQHDAPLLRTTGWCVRMVRRSDIVELAWHGAGRPRDAGRIVEILVGAGFHAIEIQCADPLAASSLGMDYLVQTARAKITYGREPFALSA